jgi:hypothetical protein
MKKIKKLLLILTTLMGISFSALCQPYQKGTFSVSTGGEVLFAESNLNTSHNTGLGATLKGEYVFGKHATATVASGYYFMNGKSTEPVDYENISAVPVKGGVRYYLGSFYGAGEAGIIYFSGYNQGTGFVYSFGLGDKIKLSSRVVDIALRHEAWVIAGNTNAVIALRLGYEFAVNQKSNRHLGF